MAPVLSIYIDQMLLQKGTALLNAGSYSPVPAPVFQRATELRRKLAENPNQFYWRIMPGLLDSSRQALKNDLGVKSGALLLQPNTTLAMNLVFRSIIKPGIRIVAMNHEYGALALALKILGQSQNAKINVIQLRPESLTSQKAILQAFKDQAKDDFDLFYTSHVTSPTGLILPLRALNEWAHSRGAMTVIDGAHAPGMVPLDLDNLGADFYAGNCHKWMMTPTGAAFLYVAPKHRTLLTPFVLSWGAEYDVKKEDESSGWGGSFWERSMEYHGSQDRTAQCVIAEAINFRKEIGDQMISRRVGELADYGALKMAELGMKPLIPSRLDPDSGEPLRHSMTAFPFRTLPDRNAAMAWLGENRQVEVGFTGISNSEGFLRISTAWFNREEEIDRLAAALPDLPAFK